MKSILIICTANKTRSVIAMELANSIARKSGKTEEFFFDSAGTAVMGSEIDHTAKRILAEEGIESSHTPAHFSYLDLSDYDEIHVMTGSHKTLLCSYHKKNAELERKIRVLNIEDPFEKGEEAYYGCFNKLKKIYEKFING